MKRTALRCRLLAIGDFPEGGATSQRLYMLARLLQEGIGDTELWIMHPTSKVPVPDNALCSGEWGGVRFTYLSGTTVRPAETGGAFVDTVTGIYRSVRAIMRRGVERPDVLVIYTPNFLKFILPVLAAKLMRIPLIFEACEIRSKSSDPLAGFLRRLVNSGETLMERLIPVVASGLLAISRRIQQYYEGLGMATERVYLLPVLIDPERYEKDGSVCVEQLRHTDFLLNSGSFSEKDGIAHIVEAVARARTEYPGIKLVFTGAAPPTTQEWVLGMAGPGGKDWIVFTGLLSRAALIWCYKNARGLLSCRSNSEYANYGFPTKLAEYLASGSPVIATTVGDVNEYLKDEETAYLAEPENVESIAMAIRRLLSDPERAGRIGRRGSEVAARYFSYKNHTEGVSAFIRRMLGEKGA